MAIFIPRAYPARYRALLIVLSFFVMAVFGGCSSKNPPFKLYDSYLLQEIECVAIVPFFNRTTSTSAGTILERVLFNELSASGYFSAIDSSEVLLSLKNSPIVYKDGTDLQNNADLLRRIGQHLKVQGIITGEVKSFRYINLKTSGESVPKLSYSMSLYHIPTGSRVWSQDISVSGSTITGRNRNSLSRETIIALNQAVRRLESELIEREKIKQYRPCGVWMDTLPHPSS